MTPGVDGVDPAGPERRKPDGEQGRGAQKNRHGYKHDRVQGFCPKQEAGHEASDAKRQHDTGMNPERLLGRLHLHQFVETLDLARSE